MVAVIRAEHITVQVRELISGVTSPPFQLLIHLQLEVVCLGQYSEPSVIGVVP